MKKMIVNLRDDIVLDITVENNRAYARLALALNESYYLMKNSVLSTEVIKLDENMNDMDILSYIKNRITVDSINKSYGKRYNIRSNGKLWLTLEYLVLEDYNLSKLQINRPYDRKLGNYLTNVEEIDVRDYSYIDCTIKSIDDFIIYRNDDYVWFVKGDDR